MRAAQIIELGSPPEIVELPDVEGLRIEAVALSVDTRLLHFFDLETGEGLYAAPTAGT